MYKKKLILFAPIRLSKILPVSNLKTSLPSVISSVFYRKVVIFSFLSTLNTLSEIFFRFCGVRRKSAPTLDSVFSKRRGVIRGVLRRFSARKGQDISQFKFFAQSAFLKIFFVYRRVFRNLRNYISEFLDFSRINCLFADNYKYNFFSFFKKFAYYFYDTRRSCFLLQYRLTRSYRSIFSLPLNFIKVNSVKPRFMVPTYIFGPVCGTATFYASRFLYAFSLNLLRFKRRSSVSKFTISQKLIFRRLRLIKP